MNIYTLRPKIREALWLWFLLSGYAKATGEQWVLVANGNGISDEELATHLMVPGATARRWRLRLETAGAIRTTRVGPRHRRFEIFDFAAQPPEQKPPTGLIN